MQHYMHPLRHFCNNSLSSLCIKLVQYKVYVDFSCGQLEKLREPESYKVIFFKGCG